MIKLKILLSKLSEDIKTKILSKLPAKSLIRLKCVSKRWYSLIASDSHFTVSHLRSQYDSSSSSSQFSLILVTNSTFSPNSTPSSRILLLRNDESDVVEIDTSYIMSSNHSHRRRSKLSIDDMTVCSNGRREVKRFSRFKSSFSSSGIELNGALYLLGSEKQGALSLKHGILSFDLSDEEFQELDTPSAGRTKTEVKEIVKWKRKSLAVVIESLYTDEFECWSMKSDMSFSSKPLWTKRWAVRAPFFDSWRWLGVWRDRFLVVRTGNKRGREEEEILAFDLPSGGERMILGKKVMDSSEVKAFDYVESLVSIEW
ncbi:hypothetical protein TIFTF001_022000 [Ficus carica]|uniref:F-box domain-containing protein n=1 Tax=Ficus carica TaxID=3494 RepID=A0AA88DF46_FICCA|nr:hypothetical protein TIFTF001_022000 [Ficus carica]